MWRHRRDLGRQSEPSIEVARATFYNFFTNHLPPGDNYGVDQRDIQGMKTALFALLSVLASSWLPASETTGYAVHEWGTFTSVQGSDGVQMVWNPFVTPELPSFVYDRTKPAVRPNRSYFSAALLNKSGMASLQRMETPVLYFYSDQPKTVDVTVKFPQGLVTEWYPQAQDVGPYSIIANPVSASAGNPVTKNGPPSPDDKNLPESLVHWSSVKILPRNQIPRFAALPQSDRPSSHYYAARETDADLLQVNAPAASGATFAQQEKFLFYRGVGSFVAPLHVTIDADGKQVHLKNTGKENLSHLYLVQIHRTAGNYVYVDQLGAGEEKSMVLKTDQELLPTVSFNSRLSENLKTSLTKEGLFPREAAAMVNTWHDSWFQETGVRVLYTLPGVWTDRILPLTIGPKPEKITRVFVGRAELITPEMERNLAKEVVRYHEGATQEAIENVRQSGLGRFTAPAMSRVLSTPRSKEFSTAAGKLVNEAIKPAPDGKPVASR